MNISFFMGGADGISMLIMLAVVFVLMYFISIRPQRKKEKQLQEMRNSIEVGDGVTTIGGIIGRVVQVKDDTILMETGSDRTKVRFKTWAISEVEKLKLDE